jgi:hypothetical protein
MHTSSEPSIEGIDLVVDVRGYDEAVHVIEELQESGLPADELVIVADHTVWAPESGVAPGMGIALLTGLLVGATFGLLTGFVLGFIEVLDSTTSLGLPAVWGLASGAVCGLLIGMVVHSAVTAKPAKAFHMSIRNGAFRVCATQPDAAAAARRLLQARRR